MDNTGTKLDSTSDPVTFQKTKERWTVEDLNALLATPEKGIDTIGDIADQAQRSTEWHNNTALYAFYAEREIQLAHARERDEKQLGAMCETCGEVISEARRHAVPQATRCLKCQEDFDRRKKRSTQRNIGLRR